MHAIAGSQTAIGILDEALYTVSELEDIKLRNSHDKRFDRAMYTNKLSKSIGTCNLEQSDNTCLGRLRSAMHTDDHSLHNSELGNTHNPHEFDMTLDTPKSQVCLGKHMNSYVHWQQYIQAHIDSSVWM